MPVKPAAKPAPPQGQNPHGCSLCEAGGKVEKRRERKGERKRGREKEREEERKMRKEKEERGERSAFWTKVSGNPQPLQHCSASVLHPTITPVHPTGKKKVGQNANQIDSWCNGIVGYSVKGKTPDSPNITDEVMRCLSSCLPTLLTLLALHFVQDHPSWGFGLPLASTQLRYKLPATCSSTFFLNLSPLSRTPPPVSCHL